MPLPPVVAGFLVIHIAAILSTLVRLGHRFRRQQLYWDDFWAFTALLNAVFVIVVWLIFFTVRTWEKPLRVQSFLLWVTYFTHPTAIWSARLSIGVTVVRLLPLGPTRFISKVGCVVFVLMWTGIVIQKVFMCGPNVPLIPWCAYSKLTPALDLSFSLVADAWLVCWPAYILFRMKLPTTHRRLLLACFSSCVLLAAVTIAHAVNVIRVTYATFITGHLQLAVSLFLCNLLVLVTYIYRVFRDTENATYSTETDETTRSVTRPDATSHPAAGPRPKRNRLPQALRSLRIDQLSRLGSTFGRPSRGDAPTMLTPPTSEYQSGLSSFIGPLTTVDTGSWLSPSQGELATDSDEEAAIGIYSRDRRNSWSGERSTSTAGALTSFDLRQGLSSSSSQGP